MFSWKPLWSYIKEREHIRLRKLMGLTWPWTRDTILQTFKFTNVRRIHDTTTQAFLKDYAKHKDALGNIALYNCGVRRFTGTAAAAQQLGWVKKHDVWALGFAEDALAKKDPKANFWTGAYMIRGGAKGVPKFQAVGAYLEALWLRALEITTEMEHERSWARGYYIMKACYGFGGNGFMAKEVLQDYLLWREVAGRPKLKDADTWTPLGPGARRGLNRLLGNRMGEPMNEEEGNENILKLRHYINPYWAREFGPKEGELTSHDIQFCLCEFDKYERVRLNQGRPRSLYHRKESP